MEAPKKRVPLARRALALLFVVAGAICMMASQQNAGGYFTTLSVAGIVLMIVGIVVRLTGRKAG